MTSTSNPSSVFATDQQLHANDAQYSTVDRRNDIGAEEFFSSYVAKGEPLVLGNAPFWLDDKPLSLDWLRYRYGHVPLSDLRSGLAGSVMVLDEDHERWSCFGDYLDALEDSGAAGERGGFRGADRVPYLANIDLPKTFPEVTKNLRHIDCLGRNYLKAFPSPVLRRYAQGELYLGPPSTGYGCFHFDLHRTWVVAYQCHGTKRWWGLPPTESRYLDPIIAPDSGIPHVSPIRPDAPETFRFIPQYQNARGRVADLSPGDVLLLPPSWWHATLNVSTSIAINTRHLTWGEIPSSIVEMTFDSIAGPILAAYFEHVISRTR